MICTTKSSCSAILFLYSNMLQYKGHWTKSLCKLKRFYQAYLWIKRIHYQSMELKLCSIIFKSYSHDKGNYLRIFRNNTNKEEELMYLRKHYNLINKLKNNNYIIYFRKRAFTTLQSIILWLFSMNMIWRVLIVLIKHQ